MLKRSIIAAAMEGRSPWSASERLRISPFLDRLEKGTDGNASIDVRLGRWFLTPKESDQTVLDFNRRIGKKEADISERHFVRFGKAFILHPSRFVLGATLEWIRLPNNLAGSIVGKSSLGRHGLIIETAPVVHPGFSGCLTLELANVGPVPIALRPGMQIAQIQFMMAEGDGDTGGRHRGMRRPALGNITRDPILASLEKDASRDDRSIKDQMDMANLWSIEG